LKSRRSAKIVRNIQIMIQMFIILVLLKLLLTQKLNIHAAMLILQ
jgi:hypothetical protein